MENKKKGLNLRAIIPLATAIVSLVFIVVGLKDYGFWKAQPTPGFFPIIIAVVLLAASVACFFQIVKDKDSADVSYNRNELLVMLGAAAIILCTSLIGLVPSCLIYKMCIRDRNTLVESCVSWWRSVSLADRSSPVSYTHLDVYKRQA